MVANNIKKQTVSLNGLTPTRTCKPRSSATTAALSGNERANAFTLAEGGHSPLLYGDEGVAEGYSCVETKGHKVLHASKKMSFQIIKRGFTLAEVLITLGVIGVVAAVTMPTLIQNYKKHVVETKLSKFYTTVNQAVAMSTVENGDPADWVKDCGSSGTPTCTTDDFTEWFKSYIGKYMSYTKIEPAENNKSVLIYLNDGSVVRWQCYLYDLHFYISQKAINNHINGINAFMFRLTPKMLSSANPEDNKYTIKNTIEPYATYWDGDIKTLYEGHSFSCSQNGALCTKLIQVNGWKIPKDYPLKF